MTDLKPIAIIPAAGQASRLWRIPAAKELLPIGFHDIGDQASKTQIPKVVSQYLLAQIRTAGVQQAIIILSDTKLEIARYFKSGALENLDISYLLVDEPESMPHSIARACVWLKDRTVVFGMPDTIFTPQDALAQLLSSHQQSDADLTLGLFRTEHPWRFGMVAFNPDGTVTSCIDKPKQTDLEWMWGAACWEPSFSRLLCEQQQIPEPSESSEPVLGDLFELAIQMHMKVHAVPFRDGEYYDVGTPESYAHALRTWHLFNAPDGSG